MVEAIVLAAGLSSRAKSNKLAFRLGDHALLQILVKTLQIDCDRIIVVTGHYKEEVEKLLDGYAKVDFIHNPAYDQGMFSSVLTGANAARDQVLITPGDCPNIHRNTVKALIEGTGDLRVPLVNGRRGHPLYLSYPLVKALCKESKDSNLKKFRDQYPISEIEVDDTGALIDVDTYEDYEKIKSMWKGVSYEDS